MVDDRHVCADALASPKELSIKNAREDLFVIGPQLTVPRP